MKLTIGQKILFGYGLAMLFMAITGIAAYRSTEHLLDANYWVRHTFLVIGEAKDIRALSAPVRKLTPGIHRHRRCHLPGIERGPDGRAWPTARSQFERLPSTIPVNRAGLRFSDR